nr:ribonuclease H-like domain-containing protein [Tanacetum cinerariifolium]
MTSNISYLSKFEPFNGGYVSFGHVKGKIIGKGSIKTGKLEFKNVYFVEELKHNLFSGLCQLGFGANAYGEVGLRSWYCSGGLGCTGDSMGDGVKMAGKFVKGRCLVSWKFEGLAKQAPGVCKCLQSVLGWENCTRKRVVRSSQDEMDPAGGRLRKLRPKEAWETIEDLAQHEEEKWNDLIFFKKGSHDYIDATLE